MLRTPSDVASQRNNAHVKEFLDHVRANMKLQKTKSLKKQFEELIRDREHEEKLFDKERTLRLKLQKLNQELDRFHKLASMKTSSKLNSKIEKFETSKSKVHSEYREVSIEISMLRATSFENYQQQGTKGGNSWISLVC